MGEQVSSYSLLPEHFQVAMGALSGQVESTAVSALLQGVSAEACKLKAAPAHALRTLTLRMTGAVAEMQVYRVEAQVTR